MERTASRADTMTGLWIERPAALADLTLRSLAVPDPEDGELLLRVHAAAINPSDVLNVLGLPITAYPQVPGRDFSGVVVTGPEELVGRAVWGVGSGDLGFTRAGTHAEYLSLPASAVVRHPVGWSHAEAGASGLAYATAAAGLERAGLAAGQRVLVTGAAGGVGSAACALARRRGTEVIAAVKDAAEAARVATSLPAASIVVTSERSPADAVAELTDGAGVDVVFDTVGTPLFAALLPALAEDGTMVVISARPNAPVELDLSAFYRRRLTLHGVSSTAADAAWCAGWLTPLLPGFDDGSLPPVAVDRGYALDDAAAAYAQVASGQTAGRVVLDLGR